LGVAVLAFLTGAFVSDFAILTSLHVVLGTSVVCGLSLTFKGAGLAERNNEMGVLAFTT